MLFVRRYTGHATIELYAEVFDKAGCLDLFEAFASKNGAAFYGLERNTGVLKLARKTSPVPKFYDFGGGKVVPLRAGDNLEWERMSDGEVCAPCT